MSSKTTLLRHPTDHHHQRRGHEEAGDEPSGKETPDGHVRDDAVYEKIKAFFSNLPHLYYQIKYTNKNGKDKEILLTTLSDFFLPIVRGTLAAYYETMFALTYHHKYGWSEIDEMIPFERDILVQMISDDLKKQEQQSQKMGMYG